MRFPNSFRNSQARCSTLGRLFLAICTMVFFSTTALGNTGQTKKQAPRKAAPSTWSKYDCGDGVELRVSAASANQGGLLLVEVRSPKPLSEVAGKWTDKDIPFWQSDAAAPT